MKTVIQIFGSAYSGSTLLTQLLDSQADVRGLGEVIHYYATTEKDGHCVQCKKQVVYCSFFKNINPKKFYAECFAKYDCDVVVDSSKGMRMMEALDPDFRYIKIFLSKAPHEFVYSSMQHAQEDSAIKWFNKYIFLYKNLINSFKRHEAKHGAMFQVDHLRLCYRDVALYPKKTIEDICSLCNISFAAQVDREQIGKCKELLDMELDELIEITLDAMKGVADDMGL